MTEVVKLFSFQLIVVFILSGCKAQDNNTPIPTPTVDNGTIDRIENFPSRFITPRHVDVWLPDGYSTNEKYSVLYMHDGQMLFDSSITWNHQEWGVDEVIGKLIKEQAIRKCIVVGVWSSGEGRHADYFPQKPFQTLPETYRDSLIQIAKREGGEALFSEDVKSDRYLRFLVSELKPYIDKNYSTKSDRENTFIAGSSMGGLISIYAICEYPEIFGGAACLSTHWIGIFSDKNNPIPEAFIHYLSNNLPDPGAHKIYFDYGTETLDAMYEPYQLQVDKVMENNGYNSINWKTMKFIGEDHSENAWRKRLAIPLTFLLKENEKNNGR